MILLILTLLCPIAALRLRLAVSKTTLKTSGEDRAKRYQREYDSLTKGDKKIIHNLYTMASLLERTREVEYDCKFP